MLQETAMNGLPENPSAAFIKRNPHLYETNRPSPSPKPEPTLCHDALGTAPGENKDARSVTVVITSYRHKTLDPDNLVGGCKYYIDGLRYAGLIPGDSPDQISLIVKQVKDKEERTEIEIL